MANTLNIKIIVLLLEVFFSNCPGFTQTTVKDLTQKDHQVLRGIKVMSYNIHHANPPTRPDFIDIDAIVKVIAAQDPDLVALQEVDYSTQRSGEGNQAAIIAEKLGMHFYFGKAIDYDGGEYGNAILSKYPIQKGTTYLLPNEPEAGTEDRIMAAGKIKLPNGKKIIFASTHLDYLSYSPSRILQINRILEISEEMDHPVILAGDFNAAPGSKTIDLLKSGFSLTCGSCPPTIPVLEPSRAIDFIAYNHPDKKFWTKSHQVINEAYASDHRPVLAIIGLLE